MNQYQNKKMPCGLPMIRRACLFNRQYKSKLQTFGHGVHLRKSGKKPVLTSVDVDVIEKASA